MVTSPDDREDCNQSVAGGVAEVGLRKPGDWRAPNFHAGAWCVRRTRDGGNLSTPVKHLGVNACGREPTLTNQRVGFLCQDARSGVPGVSCIA
jgi:hypothetical protein